MLRALATAATGMDAQTSRIDTIANNLANVSTNGFKKQRAEFQDLFYDIVRPASASPDGTGSTSSVNVGLGVRLAGVSRVFSQGDMSATNAELDVAIEGDGFLQVRMPDGQIGYTRDGSLRKNVNGDLVTLDGYAIVPDINIPQEAVSVGIDRDGKVSARLIDGQQMELGQINLVRFNNPSALTPMGRNLYASTVLSGEPVEAEPGTEGTGTLAQGFLEGSNVNVAEELVSMIVAQRAYELTAKVIEASDQMLQRASNLR